MLGALFIAVMVCAMLAYYKVYNFVQFQADVRIRNLDDLDLRYSIPEYVRGVDVPREIKATYCIFESCGPVSGVILLFIFLGLHKSDLAVLAAIVPVITTIGAIRSWILIYRSRDR